MTPVVTIRVCTVGISPDLARPDGSPHAVDRGMVPAPQLVGMLRQLQMFSDPYPEREDLAGPAVRLEGSAAFLTLLADGGHFYCVELDSHLEAMELEGFASGRLVLPSIQRRQAEQSSSAGGALRTLLGVIVGLVVSFFGVGGGVAIIRNSDEQYYQLAGIFLIPIALSLGTMIYRGIRGSKPAGLDGPIPGTPQASEPWQAAPQPAQPSPGYPPPGMPHAAMAAPQSAQAAPATKRAIQPAQGSGQIPTRVALRFDGGSKSGQQISLPLNEPIRIGRHADNTISFDPQLDLAISGYHAEIVARPQGAVVRDLGSSGGTYVDGKRITEWLLRPGQIITFGQDGPRAVVVEA